MPQHTVQTLRHEKSMKIGFIGMGNMATAVTGGILEKKIFAPNEIIASRRDKTALQKIHEELGIQVTTDNKKVAAESEIVVLAVKPQFLTEVIEEIKEIVTPSQIILTLAAGKTMEFYENSFGREIKLVRCMPNTPAFVLEGCTGVCHNGKLSEDELARVMAILNSFGRADIVREGLMDAVSAVSGSSPAYVFMFIEAMADGAVQAGMPRKQAYEFAAQAVLGRDRKSVV